MEKGNNEPTINGYLYSLGFFCGLMVMTLSENQYFDVCSKAGVRFRAMMVPTIYRHALKMTNKARQDRSSGAIVNHMSGDVEKIQVMIAVASLLFKLIVVLLSC